MQGPSTYNTFVQIVIVGPNGGEFLYNATGTTLLYSNVNNATTDPLLGGTVLAGTTWYQSGGVININNGNLLIYAPTAAVNHLIASIAPVLGTDTFGDTVEPGVVSYNPTVSYAQLFGAVLELFMIGQTGTAATISNGPVANGFLYADSGRATSAGHSATLELIAASTAATVQAVIAADKGSSGGTASTLEVEGAIAMLGVAAPATPPAGYAIIYPTTNGQPAIKTPSGYQGELESGQAASFNTHTVTQASFTQVGTSFSIPAADAQVGTIYEFNWYGNGVQGSTAQTLAFECSLGSTVQITLPATFAGISDGFIWHIAVEIMISATGSAGTFDAFLHGEMSCLATNANIGFCTQTLAAGINTTVANSVALNAEWGSTTGAPTTTGQAFYQKRTGP